VRTALAGIDGWEFDWVDVTVGNESPLPTPQQSVERVLTASVPRRRSWACISAASPTRWFREAFRSRRLRLLPVVDEDTDTMGDRCHGADERVSVMDSAPSGVFFEQVARDLLR
jgi:hypothetical protein